MKFYTEEQLNKFKLNKLDEYITEELGMELMDERIESVTDTIAGWEKAISLEEFKNDNHTGDLEIIEELKKYKDYDCIYCINAKYGGVWGQGYVITDKDFNYIGFVRTI